MRCEDVLPGGHDISIPWWSGWEAAGPAGQVPGLVEEPATGRRWPGDNLQVDFLLSGRLVFTIGIDQCIFWCLCLWTWLLSVNHDNYENMDWTQLHILLSILGEHQCWREQTMNIRVFLSQLFFSNPCIPTRFPWFYSVAGLWCQSLNFKADFMLSWNSPSFPVLCLLALRSPIAG